MGFGRQAATEALDSLPVHRVHPDAPRAGNGGEEAFGAQVHVVVMVEQRFIGQMIALPVMRGETVGQRAAEQHVELLQAAANAEHRTARIDHAAGQRDRRFVALLVERAFGNAVTAIAAGRDVRARTGEQQAVEPRGERCRVERAGDGGHQQHGGAGNLGQRADEPRRHGLDRPVGNFIAAQNADQRAHAPCSASRSESASRAAGPSRIASGCATTLSGGTSSSSHTLPPITLPRPMVTRPRIVAPA